MKLRKSLAMAVALLVLLAPACSSKKSASTGASSPAAVQSTGGGVSGGVSALTAANAAMQEQGTVKMDFAMTFEGMDTGGAAGLGGMDLSMTGHGEIDYGNNASSMTMELPMVGNMEMIQIGDTAYIKSAMLGGASGKPWIEIPASQLGSTGASSLGVGSDPTAMMGLLGGAVSLESQGAEAVDGVQATHYTGTIDMAKAMEMMPKEQQAGLGSSLAGVGEMKLPFDTWIDDQGLLRKVEFRFDLAAMMGATAGVPTSGPGADALKDASMVMTMTFSDYGAPVNIQAPPASQVGKMPASFAGGGIPGGFPTP